MARTFNGMRANRVPGATWLKSRYSGAQGNCVELARLPTGEVMMRNSRDPDGPALVYTGAELAAFIAGAKDGEFDGLAKVQSASAPVPDYLEVTESIDSTPATSRYRAVGAGLGELTDTLLGGEATLSRDTAEQMLRVLGAVTLLHRMHRVDGRGRCSICRTKPRLRWDVSARRRDVCSVLAALSLYFGRSAGERGA
ncbi:MAG: DUF397 domain-containing protein [Propionibacteriales bacterium]|nr:DUF397 domain-containing protein [Propionibacteriales bacterium]